MRILPPSFRWIFLFFSLVALSIFSSSYQSPTSQPKENAELGVLKQDTTESRQLMVVAQAFKDSAQYDSALVYFERAANLYQPHLEGNNDTTLWKVYLECGNRIGECYWRKSDHDKSLNLLIIILEQGKENLGEKHPIVANIYHNIGNIYHLRGADEKALENHQKALRIKKSVFGENHSNIADSYRNIGAVYEQQGAYEAALEIYQKALNIYINNFGKDHPNVTGCYTGIGNVYWHQGIYKAALENHQKALKININTVGENHPKVAVNYTNIGNIYWIQGYYEAALENYQKALKIDVNTVGENHPDVAASLNNIGNIYGTLGNYEAALENHRKALKIRINAFGEHHLSVALSYKNIGAIYFYQGAYKAALENFQESLRIEINTLGENHPSVSMTYNNIGDVHRAQGAYKTALENHQKALNIRINTTGEKHPEVATIYNNIGIVHRRRGAYKAALENHQKALKIIISIVGENHLNVATAYDNIGIIYQAQGAYQAALENYQKALNIRINTVGEKHPEVAQVYNNIGDIYRNQGTYEAALVNYHKALIANLTDFKEEDIEINPTLNNNFLSEINLIFSLKRKADALFNLYIYKTNDSIPLIQLSYQTYQLAIGFVDKMRQNYKRQEDKSELLKNVYDVNEGTIKTTLALYSQTQQDSFLQQAFTAFEKSRSLLLLENIQSIEAKSFADIPNELLAQEKDVSIRLAFYEKALFEERFKERADSVKISLWQNNIFQLNQTNDSIIQILEIQYPDYYRLKYDPSLASLSDAQTLLPDNQSALLEYFVGDSSIFVFVIGKEDHALLEIKKDFPLEDWASTLLNSIYSRRLGDNLPKESYDAYSDSLVQIAHQLHNKLFAPILEKYDLPPRLIISPDGVLGYLPFDLLISELPEENTAFRTHRYLINDYQISYAYSATLLQEMQEKRHGEAKKDFVAFAPYFAEEPGIADNSPNLMEVRSALGPLHHNIPEVEAIQSLVGGKIYTGSLATEENFIQEAPHYQIVHLSTHGKANDRIGDYAYLAFAKTADSLENELLYNRDLYNLRLQADLVVLSACETGIGELRRGEGIISLARGFSYAGAKSLVTTLWNLNDAATRELMESFYAYLKAGQSKDAALRQAKLDYIQENPDYRAHPFFWAAFVPMGDMAPIAFSSNYRWAYWLAAGLLLISGGIWWRRQRSRKEIRA